ncbi:MAG: hypothetical protein WBL07_01025 [Thiothrix litoralis]|jgi:hypothetical protein|uniref:hypothetical protein n=1 Tax=Thiothrix litoralis TaxID=2891210 RepID=UPI003C7670E6
MKKLIAGLGLTILAVPSAQAWTGGIDDMRTMRANESRPIVRIQRYHVEVEKASCGQQCPLNYQRGRHQANQASGWQRSARVVPHSFQRRAPLKRTPLVRAPARPVQMYAYYVPQRHAVAQQPPRIHRIVGQAPPMCRYIR